MNDHRLALSLVDTAEWTVRMMLRSQKMSFSETVEAELFWVESCEQREQKKDMMDVFKESIQLHTLHRDATFHSQKNS